MKGYKITRNSEVSNMLIHPETTYKFIPENSESVMKLCRRGFHFCQDSENIPVWGDIGRKDTVIFTVEARGSVVEGDRKCVTDKISVGRRIPREEYGKLFKVCRFDEDGNVRFIELSNGRKSEWERDEEGRIIKKVVNRGTESEIIFEYRYNDDGNLVYDSKNDEWEKREFEGDKIIYSIDSYGQERFYEYDEGKCVYIKVDNSNVEGVHFPPGEIWETFYIYDDKGRKVYGKDSNGDWKKWKYPEENVVRFKTNDGFRDEKVMDEEGNLIHYENSRGIGYEVRIER